jgi:hypothetical protein
MADTGVESNARLTGYVALLLLVLLAIESATTLNVRHFLFAHVVIGFVLIPPVLLKLGAVGYRFARYYGGDARYRAAGPPELAMRLLAPAIVLLTIVLFATGVELWLFGFRFGLIWLALHHGSFVLWFLAILVHVVFYLQRAQQLAVADWRDHLRGAFTRRSLVVGSLVLGAALAVAMVSFPTAFAPTGGG